VLPISGPVEIVEFSVLSDEDWSCSTRAQVVQEPEKKFAAMFAGQCLPMGSDGVG